MPLTKASVLHYWSSRHGMLPVVGGRPVFSRSSAGIVPDARGELYSATINTPRVAWEDDQTLPVGDRRRAALLLEQAGINALTASTDFTNAAWTKTGVTVTAGLPDPMGGTSANTLTATAANGEAAQNLANAAVIIRTNAVWARRRTGTGVVNLVKPDGSVFTQMTVTPAWQRFATSGAAAALRQFRIQIVTAGDAIDVWNGQHMDDRVVTSDVVSPSSGAATRAADTASWAYPAGVVLQGTCGYVRFIERGTAALSLAGFNPRVLHIGKADDTNTRLRVYATSGLYAVQYQTPVGQVSTNVTTSPAIGDTVELLWRHDNTAGTIELTQSINAGTATTTGPTAGLSFAAYSDLVLWLNGVGTTSHGANSFLDVRIVMDVDVTATTAATRLAELRAFELSSVGDVL